LFNHHQDKLEYFKEIKQDYQYSLQLFK